MSKIERKQRQAIYSEPKEYSKEELKTFEKELEGYKIDIPHYKGNNGKPYFGAIGKHKWLQDNGALSERSTPSNWVVKDIQQYQDLTEKEDQLNKLLKKREYAIKQEKIATDKLAEDMKIKNEISPDSFID